ncbi:MAG: WbqC family protein [Balneolaceae bacterium]
MSSIAVMQPYFFPYIGYFQLIAAVDKFVFYDDVNFIKNGWINRNRLLIHGESKYFTIPCKDVSSNKLIKEIEHSLDDHSKNKLLKKIKFTYSNAPYFEQVFNLIQGLFYKNIKKISDLAVESVVTSSNYIGIECEFSKSSEKYNNKDLMAADRLIDICKVENMQKYINLIGGKELYDNNYFRQQGDIDLLFLHPEIKEYEQFRNDFIPGLSIIDVMMFNNPEVIKESLLTSYNLI